MNVLQSLIELYNHLSPDSTYRHVLEVILTHLQEAADASIYDLAELTDSSRTTIWRMLQMLGFDSYARFRSALKQAVENYPFYNRILNCPGSEIRQRASAQLRDAARWLEEQLPTEELTRMAKLVSEKREVFFFFPYRTAAIYSFQQNLAFAGKRTALCCLLPEMLQLAETAGEDTLAVCMTIEYAETNNWKPLFERLSQGGAEIAMCGHTRYDRFVDYPLCRTELDTLAMLQCCDAYLYAWSETFRSRYLTER